MKEFVFCRIIFFKSISRHFINFKNLICEIKKNFIIFYNLNKENNNEKEKEKEIFYLRLFSYFFFSFFSYLFSSLRQTFLISIHFISFH